MDILFFVGDRLLLDNAPIEHFQHAIQILLTLVNQKNAIQGESVLHFQSESAAACPVRAGADIFLRMRKQGCSEATPVGEYLTNQGLRLVSASDITAVLQAEKIRGRAARLGFAPEDVRTHTLRSGGSMIMHIAGIPDQTLMAIGRWRSLGFMAYIQQLISSFSAGVLVKISQQPWCQYPQAIFRPSRPPNHPFHTPPDPGAVWWSEWKDFADCQRNLHLIAWSLHRHIFQPKILQLHRARVH